MAAREALGVTREELAALLSLDWSTYLAAERSEELTPAVSEALDRVVSQRRALDLIEKEAVVPRRYRGDVFQKDKSPWRRLGTVPLVFVGAYYAAHLFNAGRAWVGLLVAWITLMAVPFALHDYRCACSSRLGPLDLLRRKCPECGSRVRLL